MFVILYSELFCIFKNFLKEEKTSQVYNGGLQLLKHLEKLPQFFKLYWAPYRFTVYYVCFGKTSKLP